MRMGSRRNLRLLGGGFACVLVAIAAVTLTTPSSFNLPGQAFAGEQSRAQALIRNICSTCHRFDGEAKSRFELKAPDLMWAGSKFKRDWLIRWLTGKEDPIYSKGYRWDFDREPDRHVAVSEMEAEAIADYFYENLKDPRVKEGAFDLSTFSEIERSMGKKLFKDHACIACHAVKDDGNLVGGPQSASLAKAGERLKADWIYRFNSNPPDFVPHSGEFVADVSPLGLRYITGYIATNGLENFQFYKPWESKEFEQASVKRGGEIYRTYCAQCHGKEGKGDGPAASGLNPRPAVHANTAFDQVPIDYLYSIIYYGGPSVNRSHLMPYWGLTIKKQGVADVIAYLRNTFTGGPQKQAEAGAKGGPVGQCPQPRQTKKAPAEFLQKENPLKPTQGNLNAGERLFQEAAKPVACVQCHGEDGSGRGPLGGGLVPHPRNFTCGKMMKDIPDGQLFWIIKNGSQGTGMMPFANLSDEQVWQLILYIREFAK